MVALRGQPTEDVLKFLYALLQAGNWVMIPAMRETRAIAVSPTAFKSVPSTFPEPLVCQSHQEIGLLLSGGVKVWQDYRDHVIRKAGGNAATP
jgi:hypothetical protein